MAGIAGPLAAARLMFFLALAGVAIWAFAEATLFFIVADVPIMAVALKWGWRRGAVAAVVAALFAAAGGFAVFAASAAVPEWAEAVLLKVPGIDKAMLDEVLSDYGMGSYPAMLGGAFSGVPYKLYAFAAGLNMVPVPEFLVQSFFARLPRFVLIALVSGWLGKVLRPYLPGWQTWAVFALAWTGFYAWYFSVLGW